MTPQEYNTTRCRQICYNVSSPSDESTLTDLVTTITSTIATTTLPKVLTTFTTPDPTSFYDNFTTNESLISNSTVFSDAFNLTDTLLWNDFKDKFQDYLSYILGSVNFNGSEIQNATNLNLTIGDTNPINFSTIWQETTTYETFKEIITPFLNKTFDDIGERFETQLSTFYEEISSTIASIQDSWEECENVCDIFTPTTPSIKSTLMALSTTTVDPLDLSQGSYQNRTKLRSLCWETMFGQELVKLTVMDFVFTVAGTIGIDFARGVFVRVMSRCWCWDLEKKFPEYGEFKVAENILHLVNNQGMVWMGMFFSPGLVVLNVIKLIFLMYLRSWAVLTCNVPHEIIFRASRSNNFYFALLLTMLFLCVLPVGYAIVWVQPSWHCGPFSNYLYIYHILTRTIKKLVPRKLHKSLDYLVSPAIVIPLLVLLVLIIYYMISLTNSLREANGDLKVSFS